MTNPFYEIPSIDFSVHALVDILRLAIIVSSQKQHIKNSAVSAENLQTNTLAKFKPTSIVTQLPLEYTALRKCDTFYENENEKAVKLKGFVESTRVKTEDHS